MLCTSVAIILGKHSADRRGTHVTVMTLFMLLAGATRRTAASQTSVLSGSNHSKAGSLTTTTTHLSLKQSAAALRRRQLVQSVSTVADLRFHLEGAAPEIELAEGTYSLGGTQLAISHNVSIRAAPDAIVILDGQDRSRVLSISGGDVTLSGLSITGGIAKGLMVRACLWNLPGTFFQRICRKKLP